jgi:hypothetical protein
MMPVIAVLVVRHSGVPVTGTPLDQHDLHRLPGELEKPDSGSSATQARSRDDNPARRPEMVTHFTKPPSSPAMTARRIAGPVKGAATGILSSRPRGEEYPGG